MWVKYASFQHFNEFNNYDHISEQNNIVFIEWIVWTKQKLNNFIQKTDFVWVREQQHSKAYYIYLFSTV